MMESDCMDIDVTPHNVHHNYGDDVGTNIEDDDVGTNIEDDDVGTNIEDDGVGTNIENEEEVSNDGDNEVDLGRSMLKAEILRLGHVIEDLQKTKIFISDVYALFRRFCLTVILCWWSVVHAPCEA
ncbi:hypothetical protein BGZ82_008638 [Podila clonocystis]|nr:hypothetical protein BGZ82_008638 [Podila clonocystis]